MLLCPDRGVHFAATAHFFPENAVSNEELIQLSGLGVSSEWIFERTGIKQRHFLPKDQATSDMCVPVVKKLCEDAGIELEQIGRIIIATTSPDYPTPSTACVVQGKLGIENQCPCLDIAASCTGFLYALDFGARCILTGEENVVVVAAETRSRYLNFKDRSTTVLFGDGAGGVLLKPGPKGRGLLSIATIAEGSGAKTVYVPAGGSAKPASHETIDGGEHGLLMTDGAQVFVAAVEGMQMAMGRALKGAKISLEELDLLIPHQANGNMLKEISRQLSLSDGKLYNAVEGMGNTSSSALPICLDKAIREGRLKEGSLAGLVAVGGGHTAGAAVVRF